MLIAIAGDTKFEDYIKKNIKAARSLKHKIRVYDLGGLEYGTPIDVEDGDLERVKGFFPCMFRFSVIHDALKHDNNIVVLDGDAVVQKPVLVDWDFDIGVTVRTKGEWNIGKINAGVVFVSNTNSTRDFLGVWESKAREMQSDQHSLNELLGQHIETRDGITEIDGLRVRSFKTEEYNCYYNHLREKSTIAHYKGRWKYE